MPALFTAFDLKLQLLKTQFQNEKVRIPRQIIWRETEEENQLLSLVNKVISNAIEQQYRKI